MCTSVLSTESTKIDFDAFLNKHDKHCHPGQYQERHDIYHENVQKIEVLNKKYEHLEFEMNEYGDYTSEEFDTHYKGYSKPHFVGRTKSCSKYTQKIMEYINNYLHGTDDELDWRTKNAVTSVKNQGQCGSCWSFSAAGAMEGAWALASGNLVDLSEQQLMDCSKSYVNFGCNGGEMDSAFEYAIDTGMCLDSEVPYTAVSNKCTTSEQNCTKTATFSYCMDVPSENELALQSAVNLSPVSVAIEADTTVFQFYTSGVLTSEECGTNLDHGVLVVGYGSDDGQDYWIVKNSWGEDWGENGYIRIARSSSVDDMGVCGIAMMPSFIVV